MVFLKQFRSKYARFRGIFNSKLPIGDSEFNSFCDELFAVYDIPNLPSYKHAVASMIMHLGPQTVSIPKRYFALSIKKAMCNEVAFQKIQEIKKLQDDQKKLEQEQAAAADKPVVGAVVEFEKPN